MAKNKHAIQWNPDRVSSHALDKHVGEAPWRANGDGTLTIKTHTGVLQVYRGTWIVRNGSDIHLCSVPPEENQKPPSNYKSPIIWFVLIWLHVLVCPHYVIPITLSGYGSVDVVRTNAAIFLVHIALTIVVMVWLFITEFDRVVTTDR